MRFVVIYKDLNDESKWKKAFKLEDAENFGKQNSLDNDYDICVPLYEYNRLKKEIEKMKETFTQIETMCRTSK